MTRKENKLGFGTHSVRGVSPRCLAKLTESFGLPTMFYDQLGNGNSSRLPQKIGHGTFWTESLFINELSNLIDHLDLRERGFDLLGHSWSGMLGSA